VGQTKISWTDVTCNPFPGCHKVSPGCANCYAEKMARRLKAMGQAKYQDVVDERGWTGRIEYDPHCMIVPGKGKLVFVNSMGDIFHEAILVAQQDLVFDRMLAQPQHTFQILTKRADRMSAYFADVEEEHDECDEPTPFPAPNIWLGVTVENADYMPRIETLLETPAAVRFVSLEPLLGEVTTLPLYLPNPIGSIMLTAGGREYTNRLDWVIVGCESGPRRRPCRLDWVSSIVEQCHQAGVPVWVKQIEVKGKVVHDAGIIAAELGTTPDDIRQMPEAQP